MKKIKIFCGWDLDFDLEHEKQIELYVDQVPCSHIPDDTIRFIFLLEPTEILDLRTHVIDALERPTYNFLLTHCQELLEATDKAYLFPFGSTWIRGYTFPEKNFAISTLVGGKRLAPGHILRHEVWGGQALIHTPVQFYVSGNLGGIDNPYNNPILGATKEALFNSQFHICIENVKKQNWFTEKLIDCLVTKTVPIYYGAPNIGDWFDLRGFFIVNSVEEIIKLANGLTPASYDAILPFIESNYIKAIQFSNIGERLKEKIKSLIAL